MKNGFLIVDQSYKFDDIKDRDKILRYRGFDGMIWPDDESLDDSYLQIPSHDNKKSSLVIHLCNGLIKLEDYELVVTYYNLLSSIQNTYILYIDYSLQKKAPNNFSFLGYDLGYFNIDQSVYSVILNLILSQHECFLKYHDFSKYLNDNFLFDNIEPIKNLSKILKKEYDKKELLQEIDNFEVIKPVAIWGIK